MTQHKGGNEPEPYGVEPGQCIPCVLPQWISPRESSKYSPNLHLWIKSRRRWRDPQRVYVDQESTLWIGWFDGDGWFYGARLFEVLCLGSDAASGAYQGFRNEFSERENFWANYLAIGRCAIDPDHSIHFVDYYLRWETVGDTRTCRWCTKARQVLTRAEVDICGSTVPFESWASAPDQ
jgi:hypothetical protein